MLLLQQQVTSGMRPYHCCAAYSARPVGAEARSLNLADRHSDWRYGGASPWRL